MSTEMPGLRLTTVKEMRDILTSTDKLIMIYVYCEWSPDCRRIRFEYLQAQDHRPNVVYACVNVDQAPAIPGLLGITLDDIPALVIFREGTKLDTWKNIKAPDFEKTDAFEKNERMSV